MKGSEVQASLLDTLTAANEAYRAGQPVMSDTQYDATLDELRHTDPDNEFLHTVEPEKSDRQKIKHVAPMLSTEKAYTWAEIEKFFARCEAAAREIGLDPDEVQYEVTPKLDGIAAHCSEEEQLLSRGDGEYGFDISDAFKKGLINEGKAYPVGMAGPYGPGEIVVKKDYFTEHLANKFAHPRNFVTGAILSEALSPEVEQAFNDKAIVFYPFCSLSIYEGREWVVWGEHDLDEFLGPGWDNAYPEILNYDIDGIVIEVVNEEVKAHLGSTSHHHRWQIAFKRKGETAETTVKSIRWQVGRTGVVTPVIEIDSVILSGATITNVTGHNADYLESNGIGEGTRLRIVRAGEVIPKVDAVLSATLPNIPKQCPECGSLLERDGVSLICRSGNCIAQQCRQKEHFFKVLEIKGFGPAAIEKLATVPLIHFFEQMDVNQYVGFGFGMQQSVNLNQAIQDRKSKSVTPARFLATFGIEGLGESTAKKILSKMSFEELLCAGPAELAAIPSVGAITSHSISDGLDEHCLLIESIAHHFKFEDDRETESGSLSGCKVVFSGKMEFGSRKAISKFAEQYGAEVQGSLTSSTTHLVCGANVGAAKTDKAAKLNVKVLSEEEFLKIAASAAE